MVKKRKTCRDVHYIASAIFIIVILLHGTRIVKQLPLTLGTWAVPFWVSWIAIILAGSLVWLLFRE